MRVRKVISQQQQVVGGGKLVECDSSEDMLQAARAGYQRLGKLTSDDRNCTERPSGSICCHNVMGGEAHEKNEINKVKQACTQAQSELNG
jgi:hypothetical protein